MPLQNRVAEQEGKPEGGGSEPRREKRGAHRGRKRRAVVYLTAIQRQEQRGKGKQTVFVAVRPNHLAKRYERERGGEEEVGMGGRAQLVHREKPTATER